MLRSAFLLLLVGSATFAREYNKCPVNFICSCSYGDSGPAAYCTGNMIHTQAGAMDIIRDLNYYAFAELTATDMAFNSTNTDFLFATFEISTLKLDNISFNEGFKEEIRYFYGLEQSLKSLQIKNSFRTGAKPAQVNLGRMEKLVEISIKDSVILEIGNDWFATGPKTLKSLAIENTKVHRFGDRAFTGLTSMFELRIVGAGLRMVKRSMFPTPAKYLLNIDLQNNDLRVLPPDFFTNMPSVQNVFLQNNRIKSISSKIWNPHMKSYGKLYLTGNPLQCDDDLKWICIFKEDHKDLLDIASCGSPDDEQGKKLSEFCHV